MVKPKTRSSSHVRHLILDIVPFRLSLRLVLILRGHIRVVHLRHALLTRAHEQVVFSEKSEK